MQAVRYHEHGGTDVLQVEEVARPKPGPEEVLVEVAAAAINPVDTYFREGSYEPGALPWIPGSDLAGEVAAVGESVETFAVGDRVFGTGLGNDRQGTYAEYAVAPAENLAVLPDGVTTTEGAAAGVAGVTAWRSLVDHADLDPAEGCLVHGGSGGVGHVAVQLADAAGAQVVTTARPTYHDRLRALGADHVFDYTREDLADAVREVGPADVILDHRLDDYLDFDASVAGIGTRIVGIGNTHPEAGWENVAAARSKDLRVHLISMYNTPDYDAVLADLARLMADGDLVPDVARTYSLEEAGEAQRAVMEDSFFGKLVIEI